MTSPTPGQPGAPASEPGRVLALDVGNRRTGVAVSDALRITVRPLVTLTRGDPAGDVAAVARLVQEHAAVAVVVGHPVLPSGDRGEQAKAVEAFVRTLAAALDTPIHLWDESYTTLAAEARLAGRSRRKPGPGLDAEAAAVILEEWLRHEASRPTGTGPASAADKDQR